MKPRLIILTDLWGLKNTLWLDQYNNLLKSDFDLKIYDSRKLAGSDKTGLSETEIHSYFINQGISNAVEKLINLEKKPVNILGFSIGGTIAWKAGLKGLNIFNLFAISSTRLRHETLKPNCEINLIFGEKDSFQPNKEWIESLKLRLEIIKNGNHEIYKNDEFIKSVCCQIKSQCSSINGQKSD